MFTDMYVTKSVDLDSPDFQRRLKLLQAHLIKNYEVEEIANGWKCTHRTSTQPGFIVTPDTVRSVMKNLGF